MPLSRLVLQVSSILVLAGGVSACGVHGEKNIGKNEGYYVETGGLDYQVQISRQLNPKDFEDRDYLIGLPAGTKLGPGEQYFAVFLRAWNPEKNSDDPSKDEGVRAASKFFLTDTTGQRYRQIPLDQSVNRVAFQSAELKPSDQLPLPGSLARENTTQGGLILFKIPVSAYDSRPLVFNIVPPDGGKVARVNLDV